MARAPASHRARLDFAHGAIAKFSQRRSDADTLRARARQRQVRVVLATMLVVGCVMIAGLYRNWPHEDAASALLARRASAEKRLALRYGEVRLPRQNNTCTDYAFDNVRGWFTGEKIVPCSENDTLREPLRASADALPDSGPAARARALSDAFKK
jgi:hypothetical protein